MKKILPALITGLLLSGATHADENPVTAEKLSDSVYVLFGQGGNIAASVGEDGIYIIDDQFAKLAPKIKAALKNLNPNAPEFVINTHHHGDHTGIVGFNAFYPVFIFGMMVERGIGQVETDRFPVFTAAVKIVVMDRRFPGFVR